VVVSTPAYAISLDDDEEDAEDVADLLEQAKKAGKSESFGEADVLLKKAKMYGVESGDVSETQSYVATKKKQRDDRLERERKERERLARLKREKEERARQARLARLDRQRANERSGNAGGRINCSRVSSDYGLWQYCNSGACSGLSSNYALWSLCENDSISGLSGNYAIWSYLKNGDASGLGSNYRAWKSAKENAGSFASRKRFVIYYLRGVLFYSY
jgi:hypothetical protein